MSLWTHASNKCNLFSIFCQEDRASVYHAKQYKSHMDCFAGEHKEDKMWYNGKQLQILIEGQTLQ